MLSALSFWRAVFIGVNVVLRQHDNEVSRYRMNGVSLGPSRS
jgi:hypothetical protein